MERHSGVRPSRYQRLAARPSYRCRHDLPIWFYHAGAPAARQSRHRVDARTARDRPTSPWLVRLRARHQVRLEPSRAAEVPKRGQRGRAATALADAHHLVLHLVAVKHHEPVTLGRDRLPPSARTVLPGGTSAPPSRSTSQSPLDAGTKPAVTLRKSCPPQLSVWGTKPGAPGAYTDIIAFVT